MANDTARIPVNSSPSPTPPATRQRRAYFVKELVSIPYAIGGKVIGWEVLDGNRGRASYNLDNPNDAKIAAELTEAAQNHRGGIIQVSLEQFEEVKKKFPYQPQKSSGQSPIQAIPSQRDFLRADKKKPGPAAAVGRSVALAPGMIPGIHSPDQPPPAPAPAFLGFNGKAETLPSAVPIQPTSIPSPQSLAESIPATKDQPWRPPVDNPIVTPTVGKVKGRAPSTILRPTAAHQTA